eukprot:scaffold2109_cov123-Isochrysis_galbana.AAC.1
MPPAAPARHPQPPLHQLQGVSEEIGCCGARPLGTLFTYLARACARGCSAELALSAHTRSRLRPSARRLRGPRGEPRPRPLLLHRYGY